MTIFQIIGGGIFLAAIVYALLDLKARRDQRRRESSLEARVEPTLYPREPSEDKPLPEGITRIYRDRPEACSGCCGSCNGDQ